MNSGFFEALSLLGDENSVETEILVEKVKSALLKAIRKAYPDCEDNIRVDIDPANKKLEMYLIKTVVEMMNRSIIMRLILTRQELSIRTLIWEVLLNILLTPLNSAERRRSRQSSP